jgi:hypothetical protein
LLTFVKTASNFINLFSIWEELACDDISGSILKPGTPTEIAKYIWLYQPFFRNILGVQFRK